MSLRQGVTATEEHKLKTLISQGVSWDEIVRRCAPEDERGNDQVPLLADVDLETVRRVIYEPYVAKLDEAKAAGFKDIHSYEKSQRGEVIQQKEDAGAEGVERAEGEAKARDAVQNERVRDNVKDITSGAGKPVDDLLGPDKKRPPKK